MKIWTILQVMSLLFVAITLMSCAYNNNADRSSDRRHPFLHEFQQMATDSESSTSSISMTSDYSDDESEHDSNNDSGSASSWFNTSIQALLRLIQGVTVVSNNETHQTRPQTFINHAVANMSPELDDLACDDPPEASSTRRVTRSVSVGVRHPADDSAYKGQVHQKSKSVGSEPSHLSRRLLHGQSHVNSAPGSPLNRHGFVDYANVESFERFDSQKDVSNIPLVQVTSCEPKPKNDFYEVLNKHLLSSKVLTDPPEEQDKILSEFSLFKK